MKICSVCKEEKSLDSFSNFKAGPLGKKSECRVCNSKRSRERRLAEPEKIKAWLKSWRARNPSHDSEYRKANRASETTRTRAYRAKKLSAIPTFVIDHEFNEFAISEFYDLANLRTKSTRITWHVDHAVPLQSDIVCGLHWYANLQVITAKENQVKSNKYWKDMP